MRGWGKVLSFDLGDGKKEIEFDDFPRCNVLRWGDVQILCSRVGRSRLVIRSDATELDITNYQLPITHFSVLAKTSLLCLIATQTFKFNSRIFKEGGNFLSGSISRAEHPNISI